MTSGGTATAGVTLPASLSLKVSIVGELMTELEFESCRMLEAASGKSLEIFHLNSLLSMPHDDLRSIRGYQ